VTSSVGGRARLLRLWRLREGRLWQQAVGVEGGLRARAGAEREMRRFHLGFPVVLDWPRRLEWLRVVRGLQRCGSHLCRD